MKTGFRRWLVIGALIAFVGAGIFPPWVHWGYRRAQDTILGYHFLFAPPDGSGNRIDEDRLGIEWLIIAAVTLGIYILLSAPPSLENIREKNSDMFPGGAGSGHHADGSKID